VPAIAAPVGDIKRFLPACLSKAKGEKVTGRAIYFRYQRWCSENKLSPMAVHEFAKALKGIAERYGTRVRFEDSKVYFLDVKLAA
jgi:Poxvirus D5 protein-like